MKTVLTLGQSEARSSFPAAVGEIQGARRATEISTTAEAAAGNDPQGAPDPEVPEKRLRNRFTAAFKLRILQQALIQEAADDIFE